MTAVGTAALRAATGADNTALGHTAGDAITTGSQNVVIGKNAAGAMTDGHWNVIIGKDCLASGDTNGSVIIGLDAATGATGDNNVFIGRGAADGTATTSDNCIVIGKDADPSSTSVDNEITLGNSSITKFRIPGLNFAVKDTTATEDYILTVDSNGEAGWESPGGVLQVVQTLKTDTFSESSLGSGVYSGDVITCTITPKSSSSKILITGSVVAGSDSSEANIGAILVRDSTITAYRGDASSNRTRMAAAAASPHTTVNTNLKLEYLDSTSNTAGTAITYRIRVCALFGSGSHTAYVNRASDETDASYTPRAATTLTLMEVV